MNKYFTKKNISTLAVTSLVIVVSCCFKWIYPEIIVSLFSFPAAKISSLFLGIPFFKTNELTYTLYHAHAELRIIESCSGYDFWLILFSFFTFRVQNFFPFRRAIRYCAILLPASYFTAIVINTTRIIASFYIRIIGSAHVSAKYANVIHLWIGIIIFLSALIFIYILFQRRLENEA